MRELHAFLGRTHVGMFREIIDSREAVFIYDDDYRGTPLSLSLPLNGKAEPAAALSFLDNLLPDNPDVRQRWASVHNLYGTDPFTLLREYGEDCAGAISLSPNSDLPDREPAELYEATEDDIAARIAALLRDDTSWTDPRVRPRMSLSGAQGKFTLARIGDQWFWPTYEVPSTHILKPPSRSHDKIEVFESLSLQLARESGIEATHAEVVEFLGQPTFLTRRWDRSEGVRLHAEDMNQALGRPTDAKYGVRAAEVVKALRPYGMVDRFVTQLAFNAALGNGDAHAKNYSVLLQGNRAVLSPLYDTVPTLLYPQYNNHFAMRIGNAALPQSLNEQNWRRFARSARIDEDHVCGLVFPVMESVAFKYSDVFATALRSDRDRQRLLQRHVRTLSSNVPPRWATTIAPPVRTADSFTAAGSCGFPMPRAGVPCVLATGHRNHHRSKIRASKRGP